MTGNSKNSQFDAQLLRPLNPDDGGAWAFVILPKNVSETLSRRGRLTVTAAINGQRFQALLEPDGQKSHWLKIDEILLKKTGAKIGEVAHFDITPLAKEPEPELPADFARALAESPEASATWEKATNISKVDWIHWITTAKQEKTRVKRINDACDMLAAGKKKVCCFDTSGFYSKALSAPKAE